MCCLAAGGGAGVGAEGYSNVHVRCESSDTSAMVNHHESKGMSAALRTVDHVVRGPHPTTPTPNLTHCVFASTDPIRYIKAFILLRNGFKHCDTLN